MSDGKISDSFEYGQMIRFCCKNHEGKQWFSKNISPLGCRRIFYNLYWNPEMGMECDCAIGDMYVDETYKPE